MVTISPRHSRAFRAVKRERNYLLRYKVLCKCFVLMIITSTLIMHIVQDGTIEHKRINDGTKMLDITGISSASDHINLPPGKKPCALLFFGLLKDFKDLALPAIQKNIINPNAHCDVFLHTYNLDKVPTNERNNERNGTKIDPEEAYLLTDNVIIESVDSFERQRGGFLEQSRKHHFEGWGECCLSHDNMIKQWHSIAEVWKLMRQHEKERFGHLNHLDATSNEDHHYYQQIGLFRTDVYQVNPVDIFNSNATVPNFANHGGYNDRLFYGSYQNAALWADRFGFAPIFEEKYLGKGYHSEYFLGNLMKHHNISVDTKNVCMWRIRSGKRLQVTDCGDDEMDEFQSYNGIHGYKYAPEGYILEKEINAILYWSAHWSDVWDEPVRDYKDGGDYTVLKVDTTKGGSSNPLNPAGVMILGTFQSGASLLTGLLAKAYNFHVGKTNEEFELTAMKSQNDAFLWEQGLTSETNVDKYVHEQSWESMQNDTLPTACGVETLKQLRGQTDQLPWLVNDPRLSITLPTWLPVLEQKPSIIFTYRDPMEVALLLQKEYSFELGKGLLLWILYNKLAIENSATDDMCRITTTNHAMLTNPLAELDRIIDELTNACGLSRPRLELHHEVLEILLAKYGNAVNKTQAVESLNVRVVEEKEHVSATATRNCKIYEYERPGNGDAAAEDTAEASLYSKATKLYCDLERGVAYNENYVWPEITDEERNLYFNIQLVEDDGPVPDVEMDATAIIEKQLRGQYHNCKASSENTDITAKRKTDRSVFDIPRRIIEVVVAYCKADLSWMYDDILGNLPSDDSTTVKMTILSKCDNETNIPDFADDPLVSEVNIVPLSNVGGCDYAYAHFINDYVSEYHTMEDVMSSVILFIKDTPRTIDNFHFGFHAGYRDIGDMIRLASDGGEDFSCGLRTECDVSHYHSTADLYTFSLEKYKRITDLDDDEEVEVTEDFNIHKYENLRDFHERALNWTFPSTEMTPVCYGGTFAVPATRLINLSNQADEKRVMEEIQEVLRRKSEGGITVEEHYVERTWAGLLSTPLTADKIDAITKQLDEDGYDITRSRTGVYGALKASRKKCFKESLLQSNVNTKII